jgi:phage terminase large subunit
MFQASVLFSATYNCKSDVIIHQGGTSSGKTYSILQVLFAKLSAEENKICTVVGQDIPNLKAGALRDALEIYNNSEILQGLVRDYNKTDRIFSFYNGSVLEFKSYDSPQDAKSGKRHYLFVNEANGIPYPVYEELSLRTKEQEYIDYNPNAEFWVHEKLLTHDNIESGRVRLFISDHRHNPFISQKQRDKIEALKDKDYELWKVYARGATGRIEGLIFRNWHICESIPEDAKFIGAGLDFGFTNDPTAVLDVYTQDGELWIDQLIYETGLTNPEIIKKLQDVNFDRRKEIVADSSEPKSIKELHSALRIEGANKGPDSVLASIDVLKRYKINVTRRSVDLRKELSSYKWKVDKISGKTINEPVDAFNHAIDALRYVALNKLQSPSSRPKATFV